VIDHAEYRIAFVLPDSHQVLGMPGSCGKDLPQVSISTHERQAAELTRLIEEKWNIRTLVLEFLWDGSFASQCAVVEVRDPSWQFTRDGFATIPIEMLGSRCLGDKERATLQSILDGGDAGFGPFSRIGWIEEAKAWIQQSVDDHEVRFTGEIRHLNAGGAFCLASLGTDSGPTYWLKAVGAPNEHEFDITAYLAKNCPEFLPRVVTLRSDWKAWVMEEYGSSLHTSSSLSDFERAAHKLAHLQKQLAGRTDELLAVRCGDHRIETLRQHIDEIITYLRETMSLQTTTSVPKLSEARLGEIGDLLHHAFTALDGLGIPDSLMHNDISPGSILGNGVDCVFTDWCEAYVGNPFLTLELLCVHVERKTNDPESWVRSLKSIYKACWSGVLTEYQIETAVKLAPLISVFSYLYGRGDWLHSTRRHEPSFQGYSRGLARHMDRIAKNPDLTEALCQLS
jgi:hypothetical protein